MSYLRKRYANAKRPVVGLSGVADDLLNAFKGVSSAVGTGVSVLTDPYLGEVACRVGQLQSIKNNLAPGECASTPAGLPGGVGLSAAVVPLRGYVYAQQNKWVYPVAVGIILGLPMLIGYELGKGGI